MVKILNALASVIILMCACAVASAQNQSPRPHLIVPVALKHPKLTADPRDAAWSSAANIPGLTISIGDDGKGLDCVPTRVQLLWDKTYLYVRFTCTGNEIYAPSRKHDSDLYNGDVVEVFLDITGESRRWIELEVNPYNVTLDQLTTLTAKPTSTTGLVLDGSVLNKDWHPDLGWTLKRLKTAASIQTVHSAAIGWIVDIAIPAKSVLQPMALQEFQPMTLRANFLRYEQIPSKTLESPRRLLAMNWAPVMYGCPHISPLAMGYLALVRR